MSCPEEQRSLSIDFFMRSQSVDRTAGLNAWRPNMELFHQDQEPPTYFEGCVESICSGP